MLDNCVEKAGNNGILQKVFVCFYVNEIMNFSRSLVSFVFAR